MGTTERIVLEEALERHFECRRKCFLEDHEVLTQPALTWQCWPSETIAVDISNEAVREALREGGGPDAEDGWWHGFQMSWRPGLAFDGLSSATGRGSVGWATELHVDGYLAAGIWTFPELGSTNASPGLGIADFYVYAFRDFAFLAGKVYEAAGYSRTVHLTATMHQADRLTLLGGRDRVLAPAPKRKTLRWPIATAATADLPEVGASMAAQLMRIYGKSVPRP